MNEAHCHVATLNEFAVLEEAKWHGGATRADGA